MIEFVMLSAGYSMTLAENYFALRRKGPLFCLHKLVSDLHSLLAGLHVNGFRSCTSCFSSGELLRYGALNRSPQSGVCDAFTSIECLSAVANEYEMVC